MLALAAPAAAQGAMHVTATGTVVTITGNDEANFVSAQAANFGADVVLFVGSGATRAPDASVTAESPCQAQGFAAVRCFLGAPVTRIVADLPGPLTDTFRKSVNSAAPELAWDLDVGFGETNERDVAILAPAGNDTVDGGPGSTDTVSYRDCCGAAGVTARLDGVAADDSLVGVEHVIGSVGADRLTGRDGAIPDNPSQDAERIDGGPGGDVIDGQGGNDFLNAEGGDDTVLAADGELDAISCGPGMDTAVVDPIDTFDDRSACEIVDGDRDGDALPDSWETDGVDVDADGQPDLDLPAMGADPDHKDIFIEVDFMEGHLIPQFMIDAVVQAFAQAPVGNLDGEGGIALHVDNGPGSVMNPRTGQTWGSLSDQESVPHQAVLGSDVVAGGETSYDWTEFAAIRTDRFLGIRHPAFHYVIAAHSGPDQSFAGIARGIPAADFLITMHENCGAVVPLAEECVPDPEYLPATFMHELGHTLNLRHGGTDNEAFKPNYLSIMNYNFGYGLVLADGSFKLDYSRFDVSLNELALDEQRGFGFDSGPLTAFQTIYRCPTSGLLRVAPLLTGEVDWNCNGSIAASGPVTDDVSFDGKQTLLSGPIDWDRLVFDGGGIGGLNQPPAPQSTVIDEPTPSELIANRELLDRPAAEAPPGEPPPSGPSPGEPSPGEPSAAADPPAGTASPDTTAPQTRVARRARISQARRTATFRFSSSEPNSTFRCKLDRQRFRPCRSPMTYRRLTPGRHTVRVRARDGAGNVDATPAVKRFTITRRRSR